MAENSTRSHSTHVLEWMDYSDLTSVTVDFGVNLHSNGLLLVNRIDSAGQADNLTLACSHPVYPALIDLYDTTVAGAENTVGLITRTVNHDDDPTYGELTVEIHPVTSMMYLTYDPDEK